jgi:hypothetical protein
MERNSRMENGRANRPGEPIGSTDPMHRSWLGGDASPYPGIGGELDSSHSFHSRFPQRIIHGDTIHGDGLKFTGTYPGRTSIPRFPASARSRLPAPPIMHDFDPGISQNPGALRRKTTDPARRRHTNARHFHNLPGSRRPGRDFQGRLTPSPRHASLRTRRTRRRLSDQFVLQIP